MKKKRIVFYVLIFCGGFVAVSLWSFFLVIRPPEVVGSRVPADFGLSAEDITLFADDGVPLSGWFILPSSQGFNGKMRGFIPEEQKKEEKRALIVLHGYPAEKSDMLSIAAELSNNFAVLLMDLRSFGKSGGAYSTLGAREREDVRKAVDFLEARGYQSIGVFGFSLGGATALLAAAEDPRIQAVASYASYADLRALGYEAYRNIFVLKYPLVWLMELWARTLFGVWPADIAPLSLAGKLTIPIFLAHGREDEQVAFRHFERLQNALAANPQAEFFVIEQGLHGELPLDFSSRVSDFFRRAFSESTVSGNDMIRISSPLPNSIVGSPLTVRGEARGNWYFEASFPVRLYDANGKEIAVTPAQAQGDWMTTEFVPFSVTLIFGKPATETGVLVLQKDNPSGLPEYDDSVSIPVRFREDAGPLKTGILSGVMTIGPICPVERSDMPCLPTPEMFAARKVFVYRPDKTTLVSTLTPDANGRFNASLLEGDYWVDMTHQGVGATKGLPQAVYIVAGKTAILRVDVDTGIR